MRLLGQQHQPASSVLDEGRLHHGVVILWTETLAAWWRGQWARSASRPGVSLWPQAAPCMGAAAAQGGIVDRGRGSDLCDGCTGIQSQVHCFLTLCPGGPARLSLSFPICKMPKRSPCCKETMRHLCQSSLRWPSARGSQIERGWCLGWKALTQCFVLFVSSIGARYPGVIYPDSLVPRPQWVRTSCRGDGTEVQGRQSREEPHPFSGSPWKERDN